MRSYKEKLISYHDSLEKEKSKEYFLWLFLDYINCVKSNKAIVKKLDKLQESKSVIVPNHPYKLITIGDCWGYCRYFDEERARKVMEMKYDKDDILELDFNDEVSALRMIAKRIHRFILNEVDEGKESEISKKRGQAKVKFDRDRSFLEVDGKKISFRRNTNQYHLLEFIFNLEKSNFLDDIFFDQLIEAMGEFREYSPKQLLECLYGIKRRIASETGIKNLFLTTTQSVRINPDYLK